MKSAQNAWRLGFLLVITIFGALLLLCFFSFAPSLVPPALAQTNITGLWVLKVPTGDGNFRKIFFDLKQDGETVSGRLMFGPNRGRPISDGTFRDGALHFVVKFGKPPRPVREIIYDGTAQGDKLRITSTYPGRPPVKGVAERTTATALLPPPRLPLPSLHDVADNGLARTPPMGWNSWNKFGPRVNDKVVREMAEAMVTSGMKAAGYTYVNIDDTWEGPRDANGNITSNLRFPNMKALADYVHSLGLRIGIYSSPGPATCAGYTGSYGHVQQDADTYARWGFDYLKYDWCSASEIYNAKDPKQMRAVYQEMGDALLKTGRPIVFSLCQYGWDDVWTWGSKVGGNLWRTTGDISDNWNSMIRNGLAQLAIAKYSLPGHWNDPDMLEIGNGGMTNEEYRTHMSLWSMLAAPLIAGNDLRTMSPAIKAILTNREVIAIDQDRAGKPVRIISTPQSSRLVLARPLADGSLAVGLFNLADESQNITVNWSDVHLVGKELRARELWKHKYVRVSGSRYTVNVPAQGVVLLRVKSADSPEVGAMRGTRMW